LKALMAELPSWIDAGVWSCRLHPFEFLKEAA
jgi:hypothetical protein